jgi:hypothetical protein
MDGETLLLDDPYRKTKRRRRKKRKVILLWNLLLLGRSVLSQCTAVCAIGYKWHYSLSCSFVRQYVGRALVIPALRLEIIVILFGQNLKQCRAFKIILSALK